MLFSRIFALPVVLDLLTKESVRWDPSPTKPNVKHKISVSIIATLYYLSLFWRTSWFIELPVY